MLGGIGVIMIVIALASRVAGQPQPGTCPRGYFGNLPDCVSVASLVPGRGKCAATLTDQNARIQITCPTMGVVANAAHGYSLALQATRMSSGASLDIAPAATSILSGTDGAPYNQIQASMTLMDFKGACDIDFPTSDVDVLHTLVSLQLLSSEGSTVDRLLTVRYKLMVTINRQVTASSGVYIAQTINGDDIDIESDALVGYAGWCTNIDAVPYSCIPKSNVFQEGDRINMFFGITNSALPTFISSGSCSDWNGHVVWTITNGWLRYANGAGMASVSFIAPPLRDCTKFTWTAAVARTFNGAFKLQEVAFNHEIQAVGDNSGEFNHKNGFKLFAYSSITAAELNFTMSDSNYSSTASSSSNGAIANGHSSIAAVAAIALGVIAFINSLL